MLRQERSRRESGPAHRPCHVSQPCPRSEETLYLGRHQRHPSHNDLNHKLRSITAIQHVGSLVREYRIGTSRSPTDTANTVRQRLPDGLHPLHGKPAGRATLQMSERCCTKLKPAKSTSVEVRLREHGEQLCVEITDDGRGFDVTTATRGAGLTNMEDRLDALAGGLQIESTPGVGTTLRATVPIPRAAPATT